MRTPRCAWQIGLRHALDELDARAHDERMHELELQGQPDQADAPADALDEHPGGDADLLVDIARPGAGHQGHRGPAGQQPGRGRGDTPFRTQWDRDRAIDR